MTKNYIYLAIILLCCCLPACAELTQPKFDIVFDSNRSGSFGIYHLNPENLLTKVIIDGPLHEILPAVSPDGKTIAFAKGKSAIGKNADLWLVNIDGTNSRLLSEAGSFPSFSADGKRVFFERSRKKVIEVNFDGSDLKEIFPLDVKKFIGKEIVLPRLSPNERYLAFTTNVPSHWHTWIFDRRTKEYFFVGFGCEVVWSTDNEFYWVTRKDAKGGSAISKFSIETKKSVSVIDSEEPFGHEYFPETSSEIPILIWSACPKNQHSHETSNYQLFMRRLNEDTPTRLSNDNFTNRWPKILLRN